jgi:hypothetical protein
MGLSVRTMSQLCSTATSGLRSPQPPHRALQQRHPAFHGGASVPSPVPPQHMFLAIRSPLQRTRPSSFLAKTPARTLPRRLPPALFARRVSTHRTDQLPELRAKPHPDAGMSWAYSSKDTVAPPGLRAGTLRADSLGPGREQLLYPSMSASPGPVSIASPIHLDPPAAAFSRPSSGQGAVVAPSLPDPWPSGSLACLWGAATAPKGPS